MWRGAVRKVNIHEAKTTLSQLVEAAEAGEKVILARAGKPVVQLVRVKTQRGIKLGVLKGKLPEQLLDDVAKPTSRADIEALFGGGLEP
jgi:prevent-host-death family protein